MVSFSSAALLRSSAPMRLTPLLSHQLTPRSRVIVRYRTCANQPKSLFCEASNARRVDHVGVSKAHTRVCAHSLARDFRTSIRAPSPSYSLSIICGEDGSSVPKG